MSQKQEAGLHRPPTNPRPAIFFGLAVIMLGLGTFGGWSAFAKLSSAVVSSGTLKVSGNKKTVQAPQSGTIREILVSDGQKVKAGDILVQLDDTKVHASLDVVQSQYDLELATVARLRAEIVNATDIQFPNELLFRRSDPGVAQVIENQRRLFEARRNARTGQVKVMREQVGQLDSKIDGLNLQAVAVANRLSLSHEENNNLQQLLDQKLISKSRVLELKRTIAELEGQKGSLESEITSAQAQIAQTNLQIVQVSADFEKDISDELGKHEASLFTLAQQLLDARHSLEQLSIRATDTGTVVNLAVHTVGGAVQVSEKLLEIVPEKDHLVIEARVKPTDVDSVYTGLSTEIIFSGFSRREIPRLSGTVDYVSADAITDPRSGQPYFAVNVSLSKEQLDKLGDRKLMPGMPAEVYIKTGERTPIAYLTQPLKQSLRHAWREQ